MNNRLFRILEIVGIPVIMGIAVFLHYFYELSDGSVLSILFGAVNESVWEHIKIFGAAYVLWAVVELLWVRPHFRQFVTAKTVSLYFMCISMAAFFYIYTFFTKQSVLFIDIASSVVWVCLAQYLSFKLTMGQNNARAYFPVCVMLLMLFFIMFFSFTVFPPKCELFRDPTNSMYGIVPKHIDAGAIFLDKVKKTAIFLN